MQRKITGPQHHKTSTPTLLAAFLLLATTLPAHAQWDIEDSHTTASLRGIYNAGGGAVWASGTSGTVLRSEDGGYLWQTCAIPPGAEKLDFRGIQAFDENTAIVMSSGPGDQSRLYKTTDGCQSWHLLFTNPDKDGFWDAIRFELASPNDHNRINSGLMKGVLIGDPVNGKFVIYTTGNSGDTWEPWEPHDSQFPKVAHHPASAETGEALFAASNSAVIAPGINGPFAFVTGGIGGSRLFMAQPHTPFDIGTTWLAFTTIKLPINSNESSGAFSVASRRIADFPFFDLMVVGGDYKYPEAAGSAILLSSTHSTLSKRTVATTPPHGYRSSVAYDPTQKLWITVGPNGTDISTDDGKNWRPLKPSPTDPPDADKNWNALSLPFVVGPHGRIGRLRTITQNASTPNHR
jgi:photosystem II stability/assembly factor-like uncharacterized protein